MFLSLLKMCYITSYEESKKTLKSFGISFFGGTFADYIKAGIYNLKPHVAELVSFLVSIEEKK